MCCTRANYTRTNTESARQTARQCLIEQATHGDILLLGFGLLLLLGRGGILLAGVLALASVLLLLSGDGLGVLEGLSLLERVARSQRDGKQLAEAGSDVHGQRELRGELDGQRQRRELTNGAQELGLEVSLGDVQNGDGVD